MLWRSLQLPGLRRRQLRSGLLRDARHPACSFSPSLSSLPAPADDGDDDWIRRLVWSSRHGRVELLRQPSSLRDPSRHGGRGQGGGTVRLCRGRQGEEDPHRRSVASVQSECDEILSLCISTQSAHDLTCRPAHQSHPNVAFADLSLLAEVVSRDARPPLDRQEPSSSSSTHHEVQSGLPPFSVMAAAADQPQRGRRLELEAERVREALRILDARGTGAVTQPGRGRRLSDVRGGVMESVEGEV